MDNFLQEPQTPRNQRQPMGLQSINTPSTIMASLTLNSTSTRSGRMKQFITSDNAHLYKPRVLSEEYLIKASQQQRQHSETNIHPNLNMCLDSNSRIKVARRIIDDISEEDLAEDEEIIEIEEEIEVDEDESDDSSLIPVTPERAMGTTTAGFLLKSPERQPMTIAERTHCIMNDLFMDEDDGEDEDDEDDDEDEADINADKRLNMFNVPDKQAVEKANTSNTNSDWSQSYQRDEILPQLSSSQPDINKSKSKGKDKETAADKENIVPYQLRYQMANKDHKGSTKRPLSRHLRDRERDDVDTKPDRTPLAELPLDSFKEKDISEEDQQHTKKKQSVTTEDGKQVVNRKVLRRLSPTRLASRKTYKVADE